MRVSLITYIMMLFVWNPILTKIVEIWAALRLLLSCYLGRLNFISEVSIKTLHERTNDMRVAMCIYITHTHARARFVFYALLSRDL
jgi:hypothetical protein